MSPAGCSVCGLGCVEKHGSCGAGSKKKGWQHVFDDSHVRRNSNYSFFRVTACVPSHGGFAGTASAEGSRTTGQHVSPEVQVMELKFAE